MIDLGSRVSAPFCVGILGEQSAEFIKIEKPGRGDRLRELGPYVDDGQLYSLYWAVEGRGRKSLTIDLRRPQGHEIFHSLAASSNVVCESFRPDTLERWNIDPSRLPPRVVTAPFSVFGQAGPTSLQPGLNGNALAFSRLMHLISDPNRPPARTGASPAI